MVFLYFTFFCVILISFFISISRFLNCLIILENFNILLLLFSLLYNCFDNHMIFIVLMVVSTIEVIIGLVVLTRVWESINSIWFLLF
uniref:NADH dehydrogenase subunit 4L n=1 Tax=Rhinebothrium sp. MZUSP 8024 TaxID=2899486 RepID=A0A8K1W529_9CEST|nr:NADH dehydrogenase subunit 4L [Rhinebothrium sp. MZUSP 8024]